MAGNHKPNRKPKSLHTESVHAGERDLKFADAITVPIVQTSTFTFKDCDTIQRYTSKRLTRYEYGRYGTPTQSAVERKLTALEGAEDCLLFDSGMGAITTTLLALLKKAAIRPRPRIPTAPTRAARERRLEDKRHRGTLKRARREFE